MTTWIDQETGEIYEGPCPDCERVKDDCAIQVMAMEAERKQDRAKVTKMARQMESQATAKIDGKVWQRIRDAWLAAFPDKKPTATGPKSARATQVFLRLEQGASEQDFLDAIQGAKEYPYVVFGKRRATGSHKDMATDLQEICHNKQDHLFDFLVNAGHLAREAANSAPF